MISEEDINYLMFVKELEMFNSIKTLWISIIIIILLVSGYVEGNDNISQTKTSGFPEFILGNGNECILDISLQISNSFCKINGIETPLNPPPAIVNNKTYVPLRFLSEAIRCTVNFEVKGKERKITILDYNRTKTIELWIDKSTGYVNSKPISLGSPTENSSPRIIKGSTMVPLRLISVILDCKYISYDANTKTISLSFNDQMCGEISNKPISQCSWSKSHKSCNAYNDSEDCLFSEKNFNLKVKWSKEDLKVKCALYSLLIT